jgi:hypothetical protein
MLCNWRNALCKNSVPADLLGALNASAILIGDGLDVVVVGAANGGKFHEEIMAYYKYAHFLEQQDGPEYDNVYEAGAALPFSGIYHCEACGSSVTAVFSVPLPAQDHHLHAPQQGGFDGDWSLNRIIVRDTQGAKVELPPVSRPSDASVSTWSGSVALVAAAPSPRHARAPRP